MVTPGRRSSDLPIVTFPHDLHRRHAPVHTGSLATYIPDLANADPSSVGLALVTATGLRRAHDPAVAAGPEALRMERKATFRHAGYGVLALT